MEITCVPFSGGGQKYIHSLLLSLQIKFFVLFFWGGSSCFIEMQFISVQFSHSVMPNSLRPHESQHAGPSCPSQTPGVYPMSIGLVMPCHLILCCPLLLLPPIPPSIRVFSNESTLRIRWPKFQLQHQSFQ